MKYIGLIFSLVALTCTTVWSQTATDALRYSYLNLQGTARGTAVGGAMGALGGDFTSLSINPAGVGGFWKSEVMFTPAYLGINTKSSLNSGPEAEENINNINFSNLGIVFANRTQRGSWKSVALGLGMNKMNNFEQEFFFTGETPGTIVDRFAALAAGLEPNQLDNFEAGLAYDVLALYNPDNQFNYETDFDGVGDNPFAKRQVVKNRGYQNEMAISFGGNYKDKVLLGATLGIPFLSYTSEKRYSESDDSDLIPAFNTLSFDENLTIEGAGINIKIGAIAKVNKSLRLGAAIHSPTYLSLTDRFTTDLKYDFTDADGNSVETSSSPDGEFEYSLTTPWRAVGSGAYIFGKNGFVTADVEFADYGSAKFNLTKNSDAIEDREYEEDLNTEISNLYKGAINIRLGGELALEAFRLRGGLQLLGSPFVGDNSFQSVYSLGAGIRGNKAYLDLAYQINNQEQGYLPYQVEGVPVQNVTNQVNKGQILLTVGFKI